MRTCFAPYRKVTKMKLSKWLLALIAVVPLSGFAAGTPSITEAENEIPLEDTLKETVTVPSTAHFTGLIDIRPSYSREYDGVHFENVIDIGYRFNSRFRISANQWINTNGFTETSNNDFNPTLMQGFVRATFSDIWKNGNWSLSYEPRVYIPESQSDFTSNRIVSLRNYVMLANQVTSFYRVTFMEIPIMHWYASRGHSDSKGNQYFENRFYINNDFNFGPVTVSLPILFISSSILDYNGTAGGWQNELWFWPEVDYNINQNMQVGVAVRTESIISPKLDKFTVLDKGMGLSNTVAQLILRATL